MLRILYLDTVDQQIPIVTPIPYDSCSTMPVLNNPENSSKLKKKEKKCKSLVEIGTTDEDTDDTDDDEYVSTNTKKK